MSWATPQHHRILKLCNNCQSRRPNLTSHIYEIQSSFPRNCGSVIHSRGMNISLNKLFRHSCNSSKPNDQGRASPVKKAFLAVVQHWLTGLVGWAVFGDNSFIPGPWSPSRWTAGGQESAGIRGKGRGKQCHTPVELKWHWQTEISCSVWPSFSAYKQRKPILVILQESFRFHQHWGQGTKVSTCKTARKKGIWDFRKGSFH